MNKTILSIFFVIYSTCLTNLAHSFENKILFKINNEIITSIDILNELRYLKIINENLKDTSEKQAFEIAKRSLIREKIKMIELKKIVKEIKIEDEYLNNVIIEYFKNKELNSLSNFENYFNLKGINPNLIKQKISIEILWNQLIFSKFSQRIKIDKQNIINNLKNRDKQKQFLLSEILFNLNENEILENKYNQIKSKITNSNFSEAALTYSISDTAKKGGELGWINETTLSKKINNIIQKINVGNYTSPIVIPGGFLILEIKEIREVANKLNQDEEVKKIIRKKTNDQLNQFSNIYFNRIQKDVQINEL